jgi:putative heme-binding domain-containing protein
VLVACVHAGASAGPPATTGARPAPVRLAETTTLDPAITALIPAAEQAKRFVVPEGFEIELVAAEPLVFAPVSIAFDDAGRLYVSESHTYRFGEAGSPVKPSTNPIVRLNPQPDGMFEREVVAEGFDDPAMGILIRGDSLWVAANDYLYRYTLPATGPATDRTLLVKDRVKPWNPTGNFNLEFGPDGLLYMSVGNHDIQLQGPTNTITCRNQTGLILRMKPDGSDMELLNQGMRIPYSYEVDPFGQLWMLSNGEGNPNRFIRCLEGVDYFCYSRPAATALLAGTHRLSPPCFVLPGGAFTQLIRYYGAAYPKAWQGSLLLDNWGRHGFAGANRAIFRYVPDAHERIVETEAVVSCADPHARFSHIALDPEGNLVIADWYGRDDESDRSGRIWRLRYRGKDAAGAALPESVAATRALWKLAIAGTPEVPAAIGAGTTHADWRLRRLTAHLARRYLVADRAAVLDRLADDPEPAVRIEAIRGLEAGRIPAAIELLAATDAVRDEHVCYEMASVLAWHLDDAVLRRLLASTDDDVQRLAECTIDIAAYEKTAGNAAALAALLDEAQARLTSGEPARAEHLLSLVRLHGTPEMVPRLAAMARLPELPAAVAGRIIVTINGFAAVPPDLLADVGKRLIDGFDGARASLLAPADWLMLYDLVEIRGPSPQTVKALQVQLNASDQAVRERAHGLLRSFGPQAAASAPALASHIANKVISPITKHHCAATLAAVEVPPRLDRWQPLLAAADPEARRAVVRWWRVFKDDEQAIDALLAAVPELIAADPEMPAELAVVCRDLGVPSDRIAALGLSEPEGDKAALTAATLASLKGRSGKERQAAAGIGRVAFERTGCAKCHPIDASASPRAPSLKGIGRAQKPPYLIESILAPSAAIKTGYETKRILLADGRVLSGIAQEQGDYLRVITADGETVVAEADIDERVIQKISLMPEGQEQLMSPREFSELVEYLISLR